MTVRKESREAFTILEVLIYSAIFSIVVVAFISMFVAITSIQTQQSSSAEVSGQSQFLLQQMQYYVQQASLIELPADVPTGTLALRMADPTLDPTYITLASGTIYLQQTATGTLQALNSSKVSITSLVFTKRANPPSHDSVDISFTVSYNTSNIKQAFSQVFQTTVARVSAASFDASIVPSSTATYTIGNNAGDWKSINGTVYFDTSGHVGIGQSSPQQAVDVNGGVRLNTATAQPACSAASSTEGTLWLTQNGGVSSDTLQLCARGTGGYQWVRLY